MAELRELMIAYAKPAHTLLRKREKAFKELNVQGDEDDATLLPLFAKHPTLMQRPIFVHNNKAVLCRPHDRLLELL